MAYEKSGMFDSGDSDVREYDAAFFAEYFNAFVDNGVYSNGDNLRVYADGASCSVYIKPGRAWINGYYYTLKSDDGGDIELSLSGADAANPRIDRVTLRLDTSDTARAISLAMVTGVPAGTPAAPALTRAGSLWELGLATVRIEANSATVATSGVTDTRTSHDVCGVMNTYKTIANQQRVELCRFTASGTFIPSEHPTEDGLYDVFIVGGGQGGDASGTQASGGAGGKGRTIENISLTNNVVCVVGAGGAGGQNTSSGITAAGQYVVWRLRRSGRWPDIRIRNRIYG